MFQVLLAGYVENERNMVLDFRELIICCRHLVRRVESDLSNASFSFSTHGSLPLSAEPPERVTPDSPGPRARPSDGRDSPRWKQS